MSVRSFGNSLASFRYRFGNTGNRASNPFLPEGLTATGGITTSYTDGSTLYKAHIFTSSGTFDVTALGTFGDTVEYLVVAGGGAGGLRGAGGAGGYRSSVVGESSGGGNSAESVFPVGISTYTVSIGGGSVASPSLVQSAGTPSWFGIVGVSTITSLGGGGGAAYNQTAGNGGSGGGTGDYPRGGRIGNATDYPGPAAQGFPGGQGASDQGTYTVGGGGGGAGAAGFGYPTGPNPSPSVPSAGPGGNGIRTLIAGPNPIYGTPGPATPGGTGGSPSTAVTGGWFAGGGGGLSDTPKSGGIGGAGGGGAGGTSGGFGISATSNTGGGGGAGQPLGANGGSGIVIVRYQISPSQS